MKPIFLVRNKKSVLFKAVIDKFPGWFMSIKFIHQNVRFYDYYTDEGLSIERYIMFFKTYIK